MTRGLTPSHRSKAAAEWTLKATTASDPAITRWRISTRRRRLASPWRWGIPMCEKTTGRPVRSPHRTAARPSVGYSAWAMSSLPARSAAYENGTCVRCSS